MEHGKAYRGSLFKENKREIKEELEGLCIKSAVFKSFCHSHASGNPETLLNYVYLDSRFHGNDDF